MNKQGGFTDLFLFMLFAIIIVSFSALFIYIGSTVQGELHDKMDNMNVGGNSTNVTQLIDNTVGKANASYQALHWLSILIIFGMVLSILMGSYMVRTRPIFFLPYIFIVIIAVIVAVGLSNAYETIIADPLLASSFSGFAGSNFILLHLPLWITVIGFIGGIIIYSNLGKNQSQFYYGY